MHIKNIVFDVGNVLVRWDPQSIIQTAFPEHQNHGKLVQSIFKNQIWYDLNLGRITEEEALTLYHERSGIGLDRLREMAVIIKESLLPITGSIELLRQLHNDNFNLFALTDNTHEIVAYLQEKYDFWGLFHGTVVSASIGHLKPAKEIYLHLLERYQILPNETVFIDDLAANVEGAKLLGIHAIQFIDVNQCIADLAQMKVLVRQD